MDNKFFSFWNKHSVLGLAILIILAGLFSLFKFFSVDSLFVFTGLASDSYTSYLPNWFQEVELAKETFLSKYSFFQATGNMLVQNIPLDPLGFVLFWVRRLVIWTGGVENLAVYYFYAKFLVSFLGTGLFVYLWLRTIYVNKYSATIAGILAAFSSSIVVLAPWDIDTYGFNLAFYLFAFEQLFVKKRPYFLPIAVAMLAWAPYQLYLYSLFVGIYMVFRFFSIKCNFRRMLVTCLWILAMGVLGILINLPDFVNNLYIQLNTPRMGDVSFANHSDGRLFLSAEMLATTVLRLFAHNIPGNDYVYSEWNNYLEGPAIYCGLLTLLIFPQIFRFLSSRKKIAYGVFVGFWIAVLLFPPIRRAIVLYAGDYYRYGIDFFFTFAMIFVMAQALGIIIIKKSVNIPLLMSTALILGLSVWKFSNSDALPSPIVNEGTMYFSIFVMAVYALLLFAFNASLSRSVVKITIICVTLLEVSVLTYSAFDGRDDISKTELALSRGGYNDGVGEVLDYIRQADSSKFFRTETNFYPGLSQHTPLNTNKALGFFGTRAYHSFNSPEYCKFLTSIGQASPHVESDTRWLKGIPQFPFIYAFIGDKYLISKLEDSSSINPSLYSLAKITKFKKHMLLENDYVMPLGFTVDKYIERADFDRLFNLSITQQAVDESSRRLLMTGRNANDISSDMIKLSQMVGTAYESADKMYEDIYQKFSADNALIIASSIYSNSFDNITQQYSLLVSFVNDEGSDIDLSKYKKVDIKDTADIVNINYFSPAEFVARCKSRQSESLVIKDFKHDHIKGSVNVGSDKFLVLTIPYDKCWKCKVDGSVQEIKHCDVGFSGLPLSAGNHEVELYYEPYHQNIARILGVVALILFIGFTVFWLHRKTAN